MSTVQPGGRRFSTVSGVPIEPCCTEASLRDFDTARDLVGPGELPYTHGTHLASYRDRVRSIRQLAGFATPEEANRRCRDLLEQGQTGHSIVFDLPALMGRDADGPRTEGKVDECGVAVSSLEDMEAATLALRRERVLAYECGVTTVPDPLSGSYFLERLTLDLENTVRDYSACIDALDGKVAAVETGLPQREIAEAGCRYRREVESGERKTVGVNAFQSREEPSEPPRIDPEAARRQKEMLASLRARRDNGRVRQCLDGLRRAAREGGNTMPAIRNSVRVCATVGEIAGAMREVFGSYREKSLV